MELGLLNGLTPTVFSQSMVVHAAPSSSVIAALGARQGFAIDFLTGQMKINDAATPANAYVGPPEAKLTVHGSDPYVYTPGKGISIEAGRNFSIALSTSLFPFNPEACTVYIKYRLNAETSGRQRYLWRTDNTDMDRFATYAVADQSFRFLTGDGVATDLSMTSLTHIPDQEHRAVFGADINGKTYVDDAGVHENSPGIALATSSPAFVGIGGYENRVLRVLDGHIAEIMVVCEPVALEDRLSLEFGTAEVGPPPPPQPEPYAFEVLGARNGFAIDFLADRMRINDDTIGSNVYDGPPQNKLTVYGADPWLIDPQKGIDLGAARDFAIALATDAYPYSPTACTIYAKFRVNSGASSEQRYLFMADNVGNDRFAFYSVNAPNFRFVTGDGVGPDIVVSDLDLEGDTEYQVVFGADATGKTFVDANGVQEDSETSLAAATPTHVGIGGYNNQVLRQLDGYLAEIVVITEPVQRDARQSLFPFATIYKAEGDSHTFNTNEALWGVGPDQFYPARVANAFGPHFVHGNYGWSGDSSAEMVHKLPDFFVSSRPDIATIYAGANDGPIPIIDDTVPSASVFSVQANVSSRLEPGGYVVINGEPTQIQARSAHEITVSPALSVAPSVGDMVQIDTQANIETWIDAVSAKGVTKIAVIGYHFMNFANGGDTPSYEHPSRLAVRDKQKAAAASRNVPYIDTYTHMAQKITDGTVTQGDDASWHVGVGNTHLNAAGEQAIADAVYDAFVSFGWVQP